jgi:hypothetical protein
VRGPGDGPRGATGVLKVAWRRTEAAHEVEGLAALGGQGTVEVYKFEDLGPARTT